MMPSRCAVRGNIKRTVELYETRSAVMRRYETAEVRLNKRVPEILVALGHDS